MGKIRKKLYESTKILFIWSSPSKDPGFLNSMRIKILNLAAKTPLQALVIK